MIRRTDVTKPSSEKVIKDIRRITRKQYGAEEKIRIVLDGLRGEESIAALCRREGIARTPTRKSARMKALLMSANKIANFAIALSRLVMHWLLGGWLRGLFENVRFQEQLRLATTTDMEARCRPTALAALKRSVVEHRF